MGTGPAAGRRAAAAAARGGMREALQLTRQYLTAPAPESEMQMQARRSRPARRDFSSQFNPRSLH
eukprot:9079634-Pyramimonas_sp.AAC.1